METFTSPIGLIVILAVVLFVTISSLVARYKRCPSDKILVIYGKTGGSSAKCIHGGGAFVWPVIQDYAYLDLRPLSIEANLTNALSRQNIRVDVPCRFTIAISTEHENMNAAAERLLGLSPEQIQELAKDILFGQLRLVIATMTIEEINSDRDKFLENISKNVDSELKKIGLKLINVNVTDTKLAVELLPSSPLPESHTVILSILIFLTASTWVLTSSGNFSIRSNWNALVGSPPAALTTSL